MRAPLEDPVIAGFAEQLEFINSVADHSPGFVWRLQTDAGDATAVRAYDDETILFNLSVWESVEALRHYVYQSAHRQPLRERKAWFEPLGRPHLALWWVPAGHRPEVAEARERLERLQEQGAGPDAFTFAQRFAPSGVAGEEAPLRRAT